MKKPKPILFLILACSAPLFAQPLQLPQVAAPPPVPQTLHDPNILTLTRTPPQELEQALRQVCGNRFTADAPNHFAFAVVQNEQRRQCSLRIDPQSKHIFLTGDKQLCEQITLLISAIDQPPPQGRQRQIVPYQNTHREMPKIIIEAFESFRKSTSPVLASPVLAPPPSTPRNDDSVVRRLNPNPDPLKNPIQQVQFEGDAFGGINQPVFVEGIPQQFGQPQIGLVDDLRYTVLPSLDVLVIEAPTPARLKQITDMIRQLEELSKLNRPKIEVVYLKHVNNVSLGLLLNQSSSQSVPGMMQQQSNIYTDVFQTVPGGVRIVSMVSPNAMMLVGWGESMEVAKKLLEELDQPAIKEHSQIHFYKPKHISATSARAALTGTFQLPQTNSGLKERLWHFAEPRSNTLIVLAAPNDWAEVLRVLETIDVTETPLELDMKRVLLKHSLANDIRDTLTNAITGGIIDGSAPAFKLRIEGEEGQRYIKSGIMSNVTIIPDSRNNAILIRAPESCVAFIEELVILLDTVNQEAEVKIFPIENADATSLIAMLKALFPEPVDGLPGMQLPGSANEDSLVPVRFAADVRTNSILAAGSRGNLQIIEALVESLDREDALERKNRVYFLKNMKAPAVAATMTSWVTARLEIQNASGGGVISPFQQLESAVVVIPDSESNALIISATDRYYDEVMQMIQEIDKSPPQVVIKVLIAEISLTNNKEWRAEIGFQDPLMSRQRGGGIVFNTVPLTYQNRNTPGTVASQMLSNFGGIGTGGLVFSASSEFINIQLRALQEKGRLEVLSSPQVTTMNNQEAMIAIGRKVPRFYGMVPTGAYNGAERPDIRDIDVSLMLRVKPTISPEGTIVMGVFAQNQKVGTEVIIENTTTSEIDDTNIITTISAANGETVVIGGLISKKDEKKIRKVPVLGDTPILGKAFRQETTTTERKELLIVLTPRIVDGPEDMDKVRQMETSRMSWCLQNVVDVYGDIGEYSVVGERPFTGNAPVESPRPVKIEDLKKIDSETLAPTLPKR